MTEANKNEYLSLIAQTTKDLSKTSPVEIIGMARGNIIRIGMSVRLELSNGKLNSGVGLTEAEAEAVRTQLKSAIDLVYSFV